MHKEPMYKITLYDANCSPVFDGVAVFFTHNIEEFEKNWIKTGRVDEDTHNRFVRSKNGEIVTDYYLDNPELNIVQEDVADVFGEREIFLEKQKFNVTNAYGYSSSYYVDKFDILFRWIKFKKQYFRIASFVAEGVCLYDEIFTQKWKHAELYGNPVIHYLNDADPGYSGSDNRDDYKNNKLATFCYVVSDVFADEAEVINDVKNFIVDEKILDNLFSDVIGEAG